MKHSLAKLYVLEKLHWSKWKLKSNSKIVDFNIEYSILKKHITELDDKDRINFIWNIEKYIESLEWSKEDKLFFLLIIIFSCLSNVFDITKEPILSKVISIAKRLVEEFSEPWFIKDIVKRHGYIDIDNIESWEVKVLEKPKIPQ